MAKHIVRYTSVHWTFVFDYRILAVLAYVVLKYFGKM